MNAARIGLVRSIVLVAVAALAGPALAQDRPSEEEMFGAPAETTPQPTTPAPAPAGAPPDQSTPAAPSTEAGTRAGAVQEPARPLNTRDEELLGRPDAPPRLSEEVAPDNPLTIGGQLYLRAQTSALQGQAPRDWSVATPNLVDAYFDARPNERVRGFVLGRMSFNPTVAPAAPGALGTTTGSGGAVGGVGGSPTGFTALSSSRGPTVALDQLWIAFDIKHRVFVTAGKQHVRWGTGRIWTPTDFLHAVKRNPLDVFDLRTGTTMLRVHVPWESRAWNFYGVALAEQAGATDQIDRIAGGGRAEIVLGPAELGLDVLARSGANPRFGTDLSAGIGDFDVYVDVAWRNGADADLTRVRYVAPTDPNAPFNLTTQYFTYNLTGIRPQAVGGLTWQRKYYDKDVLTIGAEYFYNAFGYDSASVYPGLFFNSAQTPLLNFFYTGRHYAALFVALPAPFSWDTHSFNLSTIGNLSDGSFVTRFDYSLVLLTHLRFEAFVAANYGTRGGELRLGLNIPAQQADVANPARATDPTAPEVIRQTVVPAIDRDPVILSLGVALRLKI